MPGSNNFQQFNPAKNNQEDDATYAANAYRTDGIPAVPSAAPSITHNKLFYQVTTFCKAFGDMLADIGYTVSDASASSLKAVFATLCNTLGFNMAGAINEKAVTMASASTMNIGAALGNVINVTGTTTITAFDTVQAGTYRELHFASALTITHNATSLKLSGSANLTVAAGDVVGFVSLGSGNWKQTEWTPASGRYKPIIASDTIVGGVKAGAHIAIAGDGTISSSNAFVIGVGTVADGGTIPLPSGCTSHIGILVSPADTVTGNPPGANEQWFDNGNGWFYDVRCSVNQTTREVTVGCMIFTSQYVWKSGTANYLIVGVAS